MLRKKKYRSLPVDINAYAYVYHIFLNMYVQFNRYYSSYSQDRQIIHLYPGGGFKSELPRSVGRECTLISTQIFTTESLKKVPNPIIECLGGPFIRKHQKPKPKDINEGRLRICHTSLGDPEAKGGHIYIEIAETYHREYEKDDVVFYGVGNNIPESTHIVRRPPMPQKDLDEFYSEEVDILISPETGKLANGWPLGVEAITQGCLLFTTDRTNLNERSGFNYGDEIVIIDITNISCVVNAIRTLSLDRELLHKRSLEIQRKTFTLFGYEKQMGRIFECMDRHIA